MASYLNYFINTKKSPASPKKSRAKNNAVELPESYVVFDLETTGLSPLNDRIIEIGAIKVLNNEVVGSFELLVNPERKIPYFIEQKIGITNSMVYSKPTIKTALPLFLDFIGNLPLVAHNASFDMAFVTQSANRLGIWFDNPSIDTLRLSRACIKDIKSHSLSSLCEYLDINLTNAHRAYFDALATHELYKHLMILNQKIP